MMCSACHPSQVHCSKENFALKIKRMLHRKQLARFLCIGVGYIDISKLFLVFALGQLTLKFKKIYLCLYWGRIHWNLKTFTCVCVVRHTEQSHYKISTPQNTYVVYTKHFVILKNVQSDELASHQLPQHNISYPSITLAALVLLTYFISQYMILPRSTCDSVLNCSP